MAETIKTYLDDFELDLEFIEDRFDISIAKYEYPFRNGAKIQGMGAAPRSIPFRVWFLNERYREHRDFLEYIRQPGKMFRLRHPVYGLLKGAIESIVARHEDLEPQVAIDCTFVEDGEESLSIVPAVDPAKKCEELFFLAQAQQIAALIEDIVAEIGSEAGKIVSQVINPLQNLAGQISGLSLSAVELLGEFDQAIGAVESATAALSLPATAVAAAVEYPQTAPGRLVGSFAGAFAKTAESMNGVSTAPARYIAALADSLDDLSSRFSNESFPFKKHALAASCQTLAVYSAARYSEDESRRSAWRALESSISFDIGGRYIAPAVPEPIMTVDELETTLAKIRGEIYDYIHGTDSGDLATYATESAANASRNIPAIFAMAAALIDHVNLIKIERDKVITRRSDSEIPLHQLCLAEGLSLAHADRILSLNPSIRNPSFALGEIRVYAR